MDLQKTCERVFELQNAMNEKVNPNWKKADYEWYRAAWVEAAELMDHMGYRWWKKAEPDYQQIGLELVDILHFMVSDMIVNAYTSDELATAIETWSKKPKLNLPNNQKLISVEDFVEGIMMTQQVLPSDLFPLIRQLGYDFKWILAWYIRKNALNIFRQNHGYKDGSYIKVWCGREDNEYLAQIIESGETDFDEIYKQLEAVYPRKESV